MVKEVVLCMVCLRQIGCVVNNANIHCRDCKRECWQDEHALVSYKKDGYCRKCLKIELNRITQRHNLRRAI
jgi:hypothetical protein